MLSNVYISFSTQFQRYHLSIPEDFPGPQGWLRGPLWVSIAPVMSVRPRTRELLESSAWAPFPSLSLTYSTGPGREAISECSRNERMNEMPKDRQGGPTIHT